jgi:phage terminase large subunit-like protein
VSVAKKQREHLEKVTRMIPGYDAWKTAGECWFDYEAAQLAVDFFPECLTHVKGEWAGRPIVLEGWQQGFIACIFGFKRPDQTRRYRAALLYVPRKNAKTTIAAGLALEFTFTDNEPGAEVYGGAANRDQASICHSIAKEMVRGSAELAKRAKIFKQAITFEAEGSFYQVLSSKGETKHGFNPHAAIIDELHAQKSRDLVEALTSGSGARRQPFTLYTTTADHARPSICNEVHKYASDVRDGVIDDPSFLPVIYEASREDDWTSEATWRKANPNLGVSVKLDDMREACKRAQERPAEENSFKRLRLNIITEQADRWLQLAKWDACAGDMNVEQLEEELEGELCHVGLDLSSKLDLTAIAMIFPPTEARPWWGLLVKCWAPRDNALEREKKDRVPYLAWARAGLVKLTDGDVVDYDVVRADINALAERFQFSRGEETSQPQLALDRWNATHITKQLGDDGFDIVPFGQGYASMAAPTSELETFIIGGRLRHGGNPLLRWCAANIAVEKDSVGNLKPSKKKSTEKIDPLVAAIMALGIACLTKSDQGSVYDTGGVYTMEGP